MSNQLFILLVLTAVCGNVWAIPTHAPFIIGGENATIESAPFQVSVRWNGKHVCGGSILNERCILTAAHCARRFYQGLNLKISIQFGVDSLGGNENIVGADRFIIHHDYNNSTNDNDVALLFLNSPITFSNVAQPIELASKSPAPGTPANVTGWGLLSEGGQFPSILQRVTVNIVSLSDCQAMYSDSRYTITKNMLCAGVQSGGKDACKSDSGGPLVVNGVQVGIVSFGIGCGRPKLPGVYSNVAELRHWILQNQENGVA